MNGYAQQSFFSGARGATLAAVVLLHLVLGCALYFELGAQISRALDPTPLDLMPIDRTPEPVRPLPRVPMISELHRYQLAPEPPPLPPSADADVVAEFAPPEPTAPPDVAQSTAQPSVRVAARMDPQHPLRIGAAYYPDLSRLADEMGRCVVQATVATDGRIMSARIRSAERAARAAFSFHGVRAA